MTKKNLKDTSQLWRRVYDTDSWFRWCSLRGIFKLIIESNLALHNRNRSHSLIFINWKNLTIFTPSGCRCRSRRKQTNKLTYNILILHEYKRLKVQKFHYKQRLQHWTNKNPVLTDASLNN